MTDRITILPNRIYRCRVGARQSRVVVRTIDENGFHVRNVQTGRPMRFRTDGPICAPDSDPHVFVRAAYQIINGGG